VITAGSIVEAMLGDYPLSGSGCFGEVDWPKQEMVRNSAIHEAKSSDMIDSITDKKATITFFWNSFRKVMMLCFNKLFSRETCMFC
jgi:hypothetical protein